MPSQISITKKCQLLERRCQELQRSVRQLSIEHQALLLRHNLLQAWCESLSVLQVHQLCQEGPCASTNTRFEALLSDEVQLLQELSNSPPSGLVNATSVLDVGVPTIAPPEDPMAYFKHHIALPVLPNVATMTSMDMARIARESALQVGVQLHLVQELPPEQHGTPLRNLQDAYNKIIHASMSCVRVGREDLVESLNIMNLDTLEPDVEGASKQAAKTASLIDKMGITPQQQHVIAVGSAMYMQLLQSVMQERQQLQAQFADAGRGQGAVGSQGGASAHSMQAHPDHFEGRQQILQAAEQKVARLQLLMQKEFVLRMGGMLWFLGCLTWQQISKACVLCWPYILRPSLLAQEISKRHQQETGRAWDSSSPASAGSS